MLEGDSPRKNLWKNLKTQKAKYSYVQQTNNSPQISNSKDSNHNSQPVRPLMLEKKSKDSHKHKQFESNFDSVEKQIDLRPQQCPNFMQSGTNILQKIGGEQPQIKTNNNNKSRRLSIGEQSVVQEVVDFKYQNILEIGDEEDQQPMIMSLGSQSNPMIRLLKLSKVKDQIQKLQNSKSDILKYIAEEKMRYKQFFNASFQETLAFVIEFYSSQMESNWEKNVEKSQNETRTTNIRKGKSLFSSTQTPKFAKHISSNTQQNARNLNQDLNQNFHTQIQHLQQQIFKQKTRNQALNETIERLRKQNDDLSEQIFDYSQKIAQFELQVNERVQQMLDKKMKDSYRLRSLEEAQAQRKQYLDQILSLERQIEKLQQKSYGNQYVHLQQELIKREEDLVDRQKQIFKKQRNLNELQIQLNSQKLELQKKYKNLHIMENELRSTQSKLQNLQVQLALKQKSFNSRELQRNQDETIKYATQSGVFKQRSADYDYQLDLKLKQLSHKPSSITKPKTLRDDKQWYQNNSSVGGESTKHWRYPILSQKSDSYKKSAFPLAKSSHSKQRQKRSAQKSHIIINKISTPTNKMSSKNNSFSHAHSFKSQDKNRLQDLGTKLENLRNQIRKEIRDSE